MPDAITGRCCWPDCGRLPHADDSPPLCTAHLIKAAAYMREHAALAGAMLGPQPDEVPARKRPAPNERVYYVHIHDYVKIGTTTGLAGRMLNLRVEPHQILAVEPGGRELEKRRHEQFADERRGRREDFEMSDRLMAHITQVRSKHGTQ
jgi:hypothetical protein